MGIHRNPMGIYVNSHRNPRESNGTLMGCATTLTRSAHSNASETPLAHSHHAPLCCRATSFKSTQCGTKGYGTRVWPKKFQCHLRPRSETWNMWNPLRANERGCSRKMEHVGVYSRISWMWSSLRVSWWLSVFSVWKSLDTWLAHWQGRTNLLAIHFYWVKGRTHHRLQRLIHHPSTVLHGPPTSWTSRKPRWRHSPRSAAERAGTKSWPWKWCYTWALLMWITLWWLTMLLTSETNGESWSIILSTGQ